MLRTRHQQLHARNNDSNQAPIRRICAYRFAIQGDYTKNFLILASPAL